MAQKRPPFLAATSSDLVLQTSITSQRRLDAVPLQVMTSPAVDDIDAEPDDLLSPLPDKLVEDGDSQSINSPASQTSSKRSRKRLISDFVHHHAALSHKEQLHILEEKQKSTMRPLAMRHLFKKPVVKQYFAEGKLKRSAEERDTFRFELFFDLACACQSSAANEDFTGHQMPQCCTKSVIKRPLTGSWPFFRRHADLISGAVTNGAGRAIGTYLLGYYVAYIIYSDMRIFLNENGVDDVIQRLYILLTMALLIGFTANVTGISEQLYEGVASAEGPFVAAVAFLLVSNLIRDVRYAIYGAYLPKFRLHYIISLAANLAVSALFLPLCFAKSVTLFAILPVCAFVLQFTMHLVTTITDWKISHNAINTRHYVPAMAAEHYISRTMDFTVLVLGEAVGSAIYTGSQGGQTGIGGEYARAFLTLWIAFCIAWLYFAQASARRYLHAVRRHWATQFVWHTVHFTSTAALILFGATCGRLVTGRTDAAPSDDIYLDPASFGVLKWYLGISLCIICFNLGSMGHCHKALDVPSSSLVSREIRLFSRHASALVNVLLPLASSLDNQTATLAAHAAVISGLLLIEIFGKLGAYAPDETEAQGSHILGPSVGLI